jgi:hypothetical protein
MKDDINNMFSDDKRIKPLSIDLTDVQDWSQQQADVLPDDLMDVFGDIQTNV